MNLKKQILLISSLAAAAAILAIPAKSLAEEATYGTVSYPVRHATGYVPSASGKSFLKTAPRVSFRLNTTPVPGKASLRGQAGPVEDQGQCGSCWDFSLTEVLRGTLKTHGKDPGQLSFNYLLNCATAMQGCDGGDFGAAALFISPLGAPAYGSDGDYVAQNGKCKKEPVVASALSYKLLGDDFGAFPGAATPSFHDIAYVVGVLHQPVSVDVAVTDSWEAYSYGNFNGCDEKDPKNINHMVVIEGYDCGESVDSNGHCAFDAQGNLPAGSGQWLVKNSWGSGWGDSGYIHTAATDSKGNKCNLIGYDALFYEVAQ